MEFREEAVVGHHECHELVVQAKAFLVGPIFLTFSQQCFTTCTEGALRVNSIALWGCSRMFRKISTHSPTVFQKSESFTVALLEYLLNPFGAFPRNSHTALFHYLAIPMCRFQTRWSRHDAPHVVRCRLSQLIFPCNTYLNKVVETYCRHLGRYHITSEIMLKNIAWVTPPVLFFM